MNSKPLVSVIIPFLNAERFFQEALESVFAQTYDNWELLLVDDGSTDKSREIALQFAEQNPKKVRYLEHNGHRHRGTSASRNKGINSAKGEFIAFLDADDVWVPQKLDQQVKIMDSWPDVAMLYGSALWWYSWTGNCEDSRRDHRDFVEERSVEPNTVIKPPALLTSFLRDGDAVPCPATVLVRREVIDSIGGFEEAFRGMYDDQVFYTKVGLKAPVFAASQCWARYRRHSQSIYSTALKTDQEYAARLSYLNWLEEYLLKQGYRDSEVWLILQNMLRPYRYRTAPAEIEAVSIAEVDGQQLWGCYLDQPRAGSQTDGQALELVGWVLGRRAPAIAVELLHDATVIQRVPLNMLRPDLAQGFPHVPEAARGGFRTRVSLLGMRTLELQLQAVLRDHSRVPLGTLRAQRRWREADYAVGAALVSVIIPCHNQAQFLTEAIESVLAQTYPHFEIVVVDDGSRDNTAEVAARYPGVRYVRQENEGLAAARNSGLRRSSGNYLVFLDADDRLLPIALETNLNCLNAHPEAAFAAGHCNFIAHDGSPVPDALQPHVEKDHYLELLQDNYIWMSGLVLYRRAVLEYVRGFDRAMSHVADYDIYMRITRDFPIYCYDTVIAESRQHSANLTGDAALMLTATVAALRSQWEHVRRRDKQHREAYKNGMRHWKASYGSQLVNEVSTHLRDRQWKQVLQGAKLLLGYYPRGLVAAIAAHPATRRRQDMQSELERLRHRVYTLVAEKDTVQGELAVLQQHLDAITAEKDVAQAEATDLRSVVEEFQQRIQDLATKEDAARSERDLLDQRVHTLTAEKDSAQSEAAELRPIVESHAELQQHFETLAAEKDTVQHECELLQQCLDIRTTESDAAQRELEMLQQRLEIIAEAKDAAQRELAGFQQRLGALTAEKDAAQREAAELRLIVEAQTELQQRVQTLTIEKDDARRELAALQQRLSSLTTEKDAAQRDVAELQQAIVDQAELQRRIQELAEESEVARHEIASLQQTVEQQARYLDALEVIAEWIERWSGRGNDPMVLRPRTNGHSPDSVDTSRATTATPQHNGTALPSGAPTSNQITASPQHSWDPLATFPTSNQGLVPNQHTSYEQLSKYISYQQLIGHVREVVRATLPTDASVLVVSKGDEDLLKLDSRRGRHFPQDEDGAYAGYYPADSAAAIAHLEALRAGGGDFLLFPNTAFWWLEHYAAFQQHLDARYRRIWDDGHCIIYQLTESDPAGVESNGRNNRDRGLAGAEAEVRGPHMGLPAISAGL